MGRRAIPLQIVTPDDAPLVVTQAAGWLKPYPIGSIISAAQSGVAYFAHIRGFVAGLVLVKFFSAGRAPDAGWG
jgi:membrane associated rhomboid family serine protease